MNPVSFAPLAAYVVDRTFGEPPSAVHPVVWIGNAVRLARPWALRASRFGQLLRGAVIALAIPMAAAGTAWWARRLLGHSPLVVLVGTALLLKPLFAVRALRDAAFSVRNALDGGDLAGARRALGSLCSRPADDLDAESLGAATIESVAENTSDSVVAPLLFFAVFGLPGAAFYRAVNTLDAMMGYHGHLEYAGKASARLDDLLNLVPARLTALLLLAGGVLTRADVRGGLRILLRDGARTESPNAGRPMAAMAGLLGLCLEKPGHYALGDARRAISPSAITAAWRIASLASLGAVLITIVAAVCLHV